MDGIRLIQGDALEELQKIDSNSIDSIVSDPPYGIKFMSKKWDYSLPKVEVFQEMLRVLKPAGHALIACGTRTQHRMAVNIEDAGFEIRDVVSWIYGSGFPKSLNVSKAIDKSKGLRREKIPSGPPEKRLVSPRDQVKTGSWIKNSDRIFQPGKEIPASEDARNWEGWGTALKPACEFWTLARKPLSEKSVAANVLKWGTGGINIDGSRVEINSEIDDPRLGGKGSWGSSKMAKNTYGEYRGKRVGSSSNGRFPANIIHDGSGEVLESFPITKSGKDCKRKKPHETNAMAGTLNTLNREEISYGDKGSAARFFYCAKASRSERGEGNNHPTVKPVKLMRYLVTLITPPNGVVLDPYAGSGSTLLAARQTGFHAIGIEINDEYVRIARNRLKM